MKRLICSVLLAALIFSISACGAAVGGTGDDAANAEQTSSEKDSLTMAVAGDINDINVHEYNGNMIAQGMVFEGLVNYKSGKIIPSLAESWELSEDGKVYTFHLREDVKFTDGEPFNAQAVKDNINAVQKNASRHSWLVLSTKIVSCDVVDEKTVNLVLSEAYYPTLTELALVRPYRMMSPKSFIDGETKNGVSYYAGTGPYVLDEHVEDQYATFKANEDYRDGAPAIKTVTFKVMPSGETTLLAFKNGEIDFLFGTYYTGMIDPEAIISLESDSNYQVKYSDPIASRYLLTNSLTDRVISDNNIKLAVWYAINRDELCKYIFEGMETPAQTIFPKSAPYCDVDLEKRGYDTKKAKSYIETSGWTMDDSTGYYAKDGQTLTLELLYNSSVATNKEICEYIQSNLKDAGIKADLVAADKSSIYDYRGSGRFDLLLDCSWGTPYDPQSTVTGIFAENSFKNCAVALSCYDELCDLINKALVSVDEDSRQEYYTKMLTILHNECPFIPLSYSKSSIVTSADLKGVDFGYTQYDVPFSVYSY